MMTIRTKFILFVAVLNINAILLSFIILRDSKTAFIISEILILLSLIIAVRLYQQLINPLQLLMKGAEAIKEKNLNIKFLQTGSVEMDRLITVYNRMIDELRSERVNQETQHLFLENLVKIYPSGIIIMDFDYRIEVVNPKALSILKLDNEQITGKQISNTDNNPILKQVGLLEPGNVKTVTLEGSTAIRIRKSNFIDRGFNRQFIILEELTQEILETQKQAYAKVIKMMAHEVNNTIGPVNSILQSTLRLSSIPSNLNEALEIAIQRNNNLNAFMRNFADLVRIPEPEKRTFDLGQLVHKVTDFMQLKTGEKDIRFSITGTPSPFMVHADEQQFEQVLINIIKNSIEAIGKSGEITCCIDSTLKQLSVTDTGGGIPEDVQQKLFSPFFSTKKEGQGVGLLLVREILINHGFDYSLKSQQHNTTFIIKF